MDLGKDELKELFDKVFSSTDNKEAEESLKSAKEICDYQFISWRALIEKFERLNDLGILKISQELFMEFAKNLPTI